MEAEERGSLKNELPKKKKTTSTGYMPIYLVPYATEAKGKEKAMQRTKNDMASLCVESFRHTGQGDKHNSSQACK